MFDVRNYCQLEHELYAHGSQAHIIIMLAELFGDFTCQWINCEQLVVQFVQDAGLCTFDLDTFYSLSNLCKYVITEYQRDFTAFSVVANITSAIPFSWIPCEHRFSIQNHPETKRDVVFFDTLC